MSDTSRTALAASRPLSCASESTSSTLDLARLQAALPRAVQDFRNLVGEALEIFAQLLQIACISAEASEAACRTSRTVSRASLIVSRGGL